MNVISMTRLTRGSQAMERSNLEQYLLSIQHAKSMRDEGIITHHEYSKIELFLAEKYCIKKGNLFIFFYNNIAGSGSAGGLPLYT